MTAGGRCPVPDLSWFSLHLKLRSRGRGGGEQHLEEMAGKR